MVPMIRSADEAERVVAATRYPPHGKRGFGGLRAGEYTFRSSEYFECANDNILVVLIIETKEALDDIEAIAAVPGVDVLMIGTFDLYLSLGLDPFRQPLPEGELAVERILEAGRKSIALSAAPTAPRQTCGNAKNKDSECWLSPTIRSWPMRPKAC